ncbi:MAG TPA: TlpA disulfide reductase family protein [Chryseolinea sp.]|nr:TlpA disulfide reductase family protein [Chryseolinea sp.]
MKRIIIISCLLCVAVCMTTNGQDEAGYPEIGKEVPEFVLSNTNQFRKRNASSQELRGKHVIIDFWNKYCTTCIESFPHDDRIYQKYKDRLDLIIVGRQEEGIESLFDQVRAKQNLTLPYAFDSTLYKRFVPQGAPHLVWINREGRVVAITRTLDLKDENIDAFLADKEFLFSDVSYAGLLKAQASYSIEIPYLLNGNGGLGDDILFRSLLAPYNTKLPSRSFEMRISYVCAEGATRKGWLEGVAPLADIYNLAYHGSLIWVMGQPFYDSVYRFPVLEMADVSQFKHDWESSENFFWYSVIVPPEKANPEFIMRVMQNDLQNYFGYSVKVEDRQLPYWKVTMTDEARKKLKSKGRAYDIASTYVTFKGSNIKVNQMLSWAFWVLQDVTVPIINETDYEGTIDIELNANTVNWEDMVTELRKQGFIVTRADRDFKALVISDGKHQGL